MARSPSRRKPQNEFLDLVHPIYRLNKDRWEVNEARMLGGDDVLPEVAPFVWETDPNGNIKARRDQAVYINFPDIFATAIIGHLMRFAPRPGANLDFGQLGPVNKNKKKLSRADQVYQSPDGPGNTGSTWDLWWADTLKMAIATGHRWIFVESPTREPKNQAEEFAGLRPYLSEYSPLDVPYWVLNEYGEVDYACIRFWEYDRSKFTKDELAPEGDTLQGYSYLVVAAEGFNGFDGRFKDGGWWKFTPDKRQYDTGTFDDCLGKVPMFPLYYERSKGTRKRPNISRSGMTELGQAAVAAMNLSSAANFNAIEAGASLTWMLGVDEDAQELALGQIARGDRFIGLPPNQDTDQTPSIQSSGQQAADSSTFDTREQAVWKAAVQLGIAEATSMVPSTSKDGPGNSGSAQQAKFGAGMAPRIVRVAANLENAQKNGLDYIHMRYGFIEPDGDVVWPKRFDLVELIDRIKQYFEVARLAGISSETLDADAMTQVAEEKGLITDPEKAKTVHSEFVESAKDKKKAAKEAAQAPAGTSGKMSKPQSPSTRDKAKGRRAGNKQDSRQGGKNPGFAR